MIKTNTTAHSVSQDHDSVVLLFSSSHQRHLLSPANITECLLWITLALSFRTRIYVMVINTCYHVL